MDYKPKPIDTSGVSLTEHITRLTEQLAKNAHDNWARQRLAEGWKYGPHRDETRKEHPCLVPYEELPESEKQYDRSTALETIKAILAMGYRVEAPGHPPAATVAASTAGDHEVATFSPLFADLGALDLASLLGLWQGRDAERWSRGPTPYRLLGERILKLGEPLIAFDVLEEGLRHWPEDVRLRQLRALALARSGATRRANALLDQLQREGHSNEETLGLLARTHKDLWMQTADLTEKNRQLQLACKFYTEAYQRTGGYWTGINAATTAHFLGERDRATTVARGVRQHCLEALERTKERTGDRYWLLATLGEAALILEEWGEAVDWYAKAAEEGRGQFGDLATTRRQARLVLKHWGRDTESVDRVFWIPPVVVFAGHMVDQPHRAQPRFPSQLERAVHDAIRQSLQKLGARLGYASVACGSDILFLEAILEVNGSAHVVLPYEKKRFIKESVDIIPGAGWGPRCERLLQQAATVVTASEGRLEGGSVSYEYANLLLYGLASIRAEQFETELVPVAVWDGRPGDGPGGTASTVARWKELGHNVIVIDVAEILRRECPQLAATSEKPTTRPRAPAPDRRQEFAAEILGILFADAVGFSKLTEQEIPRFVEQFLGAVADLLASSPHAPILKNTWGDGLYFVFSSLKDACHFALALCECIADTNWAAKGLPEGLNLRIALHAGPVYSCIDPVTQRRNYLGSHVSRAARIEPVTPPGTVYASQAFAALMATERVRDFTCEYVGQIPLAKGYGTFPMYLVRRRQR